MLIRSCHITRGSYLNPGVSDCLLGPFVGYLALSHHFLYDFSCELVSVFFCRNGRYVLVSGLDCGG